MSLFYLSSYKASYEDRKVACFEEAELIVDTCSVPDSTQPFETAVKHPE